MAVTALKITFDKERKLKARHHYIHRAVIQSGKPVHELLGDPFGGWPYLLSALLQPGAASTEVISLAEASRLIDVYLDKGGSMKTLGQQMNKLLEDYMAIESTPTPEENESPNVASPAASGDDESTD